MERGAIMHSDGTTAYETFSVIVPSFVLTLIASLLQIKLPSPNVINRLLLEFNLIVIPIILIVTVSADHTTDITILLILGCIALLGVLRHDTNFVVQKQNHSHYNYLTMARSTINIISVLCILAVDFMIFPRRFAKTKNYGYSLMDVGVGLYVFGNGIVSPDARGHCNSIAKSVKGAIPLVILGGVRFIITKEIDYHVPVSEYGVHWNFFITLAMVKILSSIVLSVISANHALFSGALVLLSHELILQTGLSNFVLSDIKRDSFFKANREGIASSLGYLGIYFLSVSFGQFCMKNKPSKKHFFKLCIITGFLLWAMVLLDKNFRTSRRLANSGYCIWIMFVGVCMTTLFYLGEFIQNYICGCNRVPLIYETINYNGLMFFLVGNLLTGSVNIVCDTLTVNSIQSLSILCIYMIVNCAIVYILFARKIKIKL